MTFSESGRCLAEAVDVSLGDHVRLQIFVGLNHIYLSSVWKFRGAYSFFWEIAANNHCLVCWSLLKGNKNQWLEFQGTLGFLFQLGDRKG